VTDTHTPPTISCQELVELVTAYFDGALSEDERGAFEAHLSVCDGCTAYVEQMRQTIELTGRLTISQVSPDAEAALLAAFRDWKRG
jgi:anti-sigma factor RsiW